MRISTPHNTTIAMFSADDLSHMNLLLPENIPQKTEFLQKIIAWVLEEISVDLLSTENFKKIIIVLLKKMPANIFSLEDAERREILSSLLLQIMPTHTFAQDLKKTSALLNPPVLAEYDLVYVLSGRSSVLLTDVDRMQRHSWHKDIRDDLDRMLKGIEIAKEICPLRARKPIAMLTEQDMVIPIFYNGRPEHNKDLKKALTKKQLSYPKELFFILDINPMNTIGQVKSFLEFLRAFPLENFRVKNIVAVTSAFHETRVARTLGCDSPHAFTEELPNALAGIRIFLYGIDKQYQRPGILLDLAGEHDAMVTYTGYGRFLKKDAKANLPANDNKAQDLKMVAPPPSPSISRHVSRNVFFSAYDILMRASFNLQYGVGMARFNWLLMTCGLQHFKVPAKMVDKTLTFYKNKKPIAFVKRELENIFQSERKFSF